LPLFKCRIIFLLLLGVLFRIMSYARNTEMMWNKAGLIWTTAGLCVMVIHVISCNFFGVICSLKLRPQRKCYRISQFCNTDTAYWLLILPSLFKTMSPLRSLKTAAPNHLPVVFLILIKIEGFIAGFWFVYLCCEWCFFRIY